MRSLAQFSGSVAFQEPSVLGAPGIWSLEDALRYQALGQWPVWTPPVLFTSGAQGCLIDLSDQTTLFQDAQGTVPVASSGQPVGMVLDQRLWGGRTIEQELERQPELWTNPVPSIANYAGTVGSYDQATKRMLNTGTSVGGFPRFQFNLGLISGKYYQVHGQLSGSIDKLTFVRLANTGAANNLSYDFSSGQISGIVVSAVNNIEFLIDLFGNWIPDDYLQIDSLTIKALTGNHASQPTTAARPAFRDVGGVRYLESDGVDDALNITLPSGTYTRAYVNASGVMTIDEAVAISGTENIMREQTIAGIVYIDRALTNAEKVRLADYWGASS